MVYNIPIILCNFHQFPQPGKVLVGKIDCDSQGRYARSKQEFGLQFGWANHILHNKMF